MRIKTDVCLRADDKGGAKCALSVFCRGCFHFDIFCGPHLRMRFSLCVCEYSFHCGLSARMFFPFGLLAEAAVGFFSPYRECLYLLGLFVFNYCISAVRADSILVVSFTAVAFLPLKIFVMVGTCFTYRQW